MSPSIASRIFQTARVQSARRQALPAGPRRHQLGIFAVLVLLAAPAASAQAADESPPRGAWWRAFNDSTLTDLVDEGLANNFDLRAASARADQAHAAKWQALTPTLPTVSVDFNGNAAPLNGLGFQFGGLNRGDPNADEPTIFDPFFTGSAMLNARVTADLGSSIMNFRAQGLDANAAETDVQAQSSALAQRIAAAYFDVVAAQAQVKIVEKQIASNRNLVEVVQMRYERGESTALDVLQQRQQLQSAEAQLPQARSQARILRYQLGLLVGRDEPVALDDAAADFPRLGAAPTRERAGALVDSRPDLTAARRRLEAAQARVAAAWLNFLPRLSVAGNTGWQYSWFDVEEDPNSLFTWGASAGLSIPLFSGLGRYSGLRTNQAAVYTARATYEAQRRQRLLAVEQARVQEEELRLQLAAATKQVEAAKLAQEKSREQYVAGLAPLTAVLIATTSAQAGEINVLSLQRRVLDARISLLDALGGEWAFDLPPPAPYDETAALGPLDAPKARPRMEVRTSVLSPDAPRRASTIERPSSPSSPSSAVVPAAPAAPSYGVLQ